MVLAPTARLLAIAKERKYLSSICDITSSITIINYFLAIITLIDKDFIGLAVKTR